MENDYIKQIRLLRQLDSFNSDIERLMEEVSPETSKNLLNEAKKYIESRKRYYELRATDKVDQILYAVIQNELGSIEEGCLFRANYLKPKLSGLEVNTSDVVRVLKRNKSRLGVVNCDGGINFYWMKPSNSELGQLPSVTELTEKLKGRGGYGNRRKRKNAAQTILENVAEKGFSRYNDNYFLETEKSWDGKSRYEVFQSDDKRGKRLIKDMMDITGLLPGKFDNELVIIYHPTIIRQLQF